MCLDSVIRSISAKKVFIEMILGYSSIQAQILQNFYSLFPLVRNPGTNLGSPVVPGSLTCVFQGKKGLNLVPLPLYLASRKSPLWQVELIIDPGTIRVKFVVLNFANRSNVSLVAATVCLQYHSHNEQAFEASWIYIKMRGMHFL